MAEDGWSLEDSLASTSRIRQVDEEERVLTPAQAQCLAQVRAWVETEAEFYGRTDDEFLFMFLFGCKFDVEKIKKKMCKYYDHRRKLPQWWANRDLKDPELLSILKLKTSIVLKSAGPNQPVIVFHKTSRLETMEGKDFDMLVKLNSVNMDMILRRTGCQMVGGIWLFDCEVLPLWIVTKILSPIFVKDFLTSFILGMPLRLKAIVVLNCPLVVHTIWALARPFLTRKIRKRVYFYRSDWTKLFEDVDRKCMPDEYGGSGGPLAIHEEEHLTEYLSYTEYIAEDNQYGYQTNE